LPKKQVALNYLDIIVIVVFMLIILSVGMSFGKSSGKSISNFFLGGRNLPWYLAGLSMVATTFAADTPLAVTELVGNSGISGNWLWWNLLAGGMLTTFFFANLWRRANIVTEVEFIELRYGGKPAAFLRGFKAIYLGFVMNVLIIGWVNLAMVTILQGFFGMSAGMAMGYTAILMLLVAIYASISGLMGVVVTDAIQFVVAMAGSILLAFFVLKSEEIGGIAGLKSQLPDGALNFLPQINKADSGGMLAMPLASFLAFFGFVWWASWYPGAEPGGGGYIAQRMMSTKNEKHAVGATLFFQVAHYCLRPWPWIIVGLSAMVLFSIPKNISNPEVKAKVVAMQEAGLSAEDILSQPEIKQLIALESETNPRLAEAIQYQSDKRFGYVFAMKNHLPNGLLGLLLAAFLAAYMSTISTQLNWGASYLINDGYQRYLKPEATQPQLIFASRAATFVLMIAGLIVTTFLNSISAVWQFIMECGAGLGLVLILRWYWWRINAITEIVATVAPFVGYALAHFVWHLAFPYSFFFTVAFTTVAWIITVFVTAPEQPAVLNHFYQKIKPDGWWAPQRLAAGEAATRSSLFNLLVCWLSAIGFTYAFLFFIGKLILQEWVETAWAAAIALFSMGVLLYFLRKTKIFS